MILIISNEFDLSTHEVLEWILASTQENFVVLNEHNSIKNLSITLKSDKPEELTILTTLGDTVRFADISYVWYRRGPLFLEHDNGFQKFKCISFPSNFRPCKKFDKLPCKKMNFFTPFPCFNYQ